MKALILNTKISIVLILSFLSSVSVLGQREIEMAVPTPKGIVVFAGMELADGNKVEKYTVERSYDKRPMGKPDRIKIADKLERISIQCYSMETRFWISGLPNNEELKKGWQKE